MISSDAFADAAVQARVDADADIANSIKHHEAVDSQAHNKAWKKHFKESEFYKQYAKHNEEESKCKENCAENKKQLVQIKSEYNDLQRKLDELKKKAPAEAIAKMEESIKKEEDKPPKDVKNIQVEAEGPAPYGVAYGSSGNNMGSDWGPGPAYPSPMPFLRGEKQWMDNAQNINDWSDWHTMRAENRIPYWSTFVQTHDDVLHEDINDDTINLDILYEKEAPKNPNDLEKVTQPNNLPLDFHFLQTDQQNKAATDKQKKSDKKKN